MHLYFCETVRLVAFNLPGSGPVKHWQLQQCYIVHLGFNGPSRSPGKGAWPFGLPGLHLQLCVA